MHAMTAEPSWTWLSARIKSAHRENVELSDDETKLNGQIIRIRVLGDNEQIQSLFFGKQKFQKSTGCAMARMARANDEDIERVLGHQHAMGILLCEHQYEVLEGTAL